ncbi:hypothetical protein [Methylibium sp.]|uniref:hypothetical protein n=1 Tax=Methylibium sp. TaxID=2067992 RepID=UPI003BA8AD40
MGSLLSHRVTQDEFAELIGVSQQLVSKLVTEGVIAKEDTAAGWLRSYCGRLREQAAGRMGEGEGLDLVQERAWLAREQRESYRIKNAVALGEFAPIGLLADVLASASAAVVDRFDALPGVLRKACPDLPAEARDAIGRVIASARNEWIRTTDELVVKRLEQAAEAEEDLSAPTADEVAA